MNGVQSLSDLARQACGKNIKRLFDIGDCPYDLVRSALLRIESPEQLHQLELNSPQIVGRDAEIWLNLIKRDVPGWDSKPHEPQDPRNWWKVYRKLKQEAHDDMNKGAKELKAAFANIANEKEQNLAKMKSRRELPRAGDVGMRQRMVHGYTSGKTGSKGAHAMSAIEKIRREAAGSRRIIPTKDLKKQASTVTKAPQDFLEDRRRAPERRIQTSPARAPVRAAAPPMALAHPRPAANDISFQDREARLRALTSGRSLPRQEAILIPALDGPSSPPSRVSELRRSPEKEPARPRTIQQPVATRPRSSAQFLEPGGSLGKISQRTLSSSPATRSPQPVIVKRKAPPSVFMETKRPKVASSSRDDLF